MLFSIAAALVINGVDAINPQGKASLIVELLFVALGFGVGVHVGVEMVSKLLLRDVGSRPLEK